MFEDIATKSQCTVKLHLNTDTVLTEKLKNTVDHVVMISYYSQIYTWK